jgi:arylsulfatase A-like enzyme
MVWRLATIPVVASLAIPAYGPLAAAADATRPNIVVFVTDDQPRDLVTMPKTRSWFQDAGTDFTNAWVTTPLCCPSRSSIFSGRYAHNTGVHTNSSTQEVQAFDQHATIQRRLHDEGYHTAMTGKYLNSWDLTEPPPYFDRFALHNGGATYSDPKVNADGTVKTVSGFEPDVLASFANSYLDGFEADDATPWFLYVATKAPHDPFKPAPRYVDAPVPGWDGNPAVFETDRSDKPPVVRQQTKTFADGSSIREQQLRCLMAADDMVNKVMSHIDALGEQDTLAIFISDNGLMWGEHGVAGHKRLPYPQSASVPLLMRWPGHVATGASDARLAANVDLAPTIAGAVGITPDYVMDGTSLLKPSARDALQLEYWKSPDNTSFPTWASIVTPTEQYTEWYQDDAVTMTFREDYDLANDPWENENLLADGDPSNDPDTTAIAARLQSARTCAGSACVLQDTTDDVSPPTAPTSLVSWERLDGVGLAWAPSQDDVGVAAYDIYRDGTLVKTISGVATSVTDTAAPPDVSSGYVVVAGDAAGNKSPPSDATTGRRPPAGTWFVDAFETGTLASWANVRTAVTNDVAHSARWADRASSTGTPAYARANLPVAVNDAYLRAWVRIDAHSSTTRTTLLRFLKADKTSVVEIAVKPTGQLGYFSNAVKRVRWSTTTLPAAAWTEIEVRAVIGTSGSAQLWVNGTSVIARSENLGASPIAKIQIGDNTKGRTYDVRFDDVVASPSFVA